jgi:hypothetical protein
MHPGRDMAKGWNLSDGVKVLRRGSLFQFSDGRHREASGLKRNIRPNSPSLVKQYALRNVAPQTRFDAVRFLRFPIAPASLEGFAIDRRPKKA